MHRELLLFFQSACLGAALLLCYDILVVLRRLIPHCKAVIAVQDVLFWILAGFALFAGIYRGNEGNLRNFLFLGSIAGFFLCRETISPVFVKVLTTILGIPAFFVEKTVKRLLFPVKRCKIFVKKNAVRKKVSKRSKQVEKSRKKESKKKNRI